MSNDQSTSEDTRVKNLILRLHRLWPNAREEYITDYVREAARQGELAEHEALSDSQLALDFHQSWECAL